MPVRPSTAIGQAIDAAILVAAVNPVASLTGDVELAAQSCHFLAIEQTGNESETFFHLIPLPPGHDSLPQRKKVLPMSPE
jgi:hypothetical protein